MAGSERAYERMFELAVVLGDLLDRGLGERGLTQPRAELLWRLHHGGAMTQRELSEALRCTPRNVTGLLDALQADDLVVRSQHPSDRRATLVTLSPKGRAVLAELEASYTRGADEAFSGISARDLATFTRTLDIVIERMRDEG